MPRVSMSCGTVMILGSFIIILLSVRLYLVELRLSLLAADWQFAEKVLRKNIEVNANAEILIHKQNYYLRRLLKKPGEEDF